MLASPASPLPTARAQHPCPSLTPVPGCSGSCCLQCLGNVFRLACRRRGWDRLRPPQSHPLTWRRALGSGRVPAHPAALWRSRLAVEEGLGGSSRSGATLAWDCRQCHMCAGFPPPLSHGPDAASCVGKLRHPLVLWPRAHGAGGPRLAPAQGPAVAAVSCIARSIVRLLGMAQSHVERASPAPRPRVCWDVNPFLRHGAGRGEPSCGARGLAPLGSPRAAVAVEAPSTLPTAGRAGCPFLPPPPVPRPQLS